MIGGLNLDTGVGGAPASVLVRSLLIDALRRFGFTKRSLGLIGLLALSSLGFGALGAILALRAVFGVEDAGTRQVLVVLTFGAASLFWLFVQVVFDRPMNFLLDLRPLLSMPIGFGALYRLRVGLSLTGLWFLCFGPAALYVVLTRSAGAGEGALLVFGGVAVVLIHGLIGSILQHWRQRLITGWLGSMLLFGGMAAAFFLLLVLVHVADGSAGAEGAEGLASAGPEGLDLESLYVASWFQWVARVPSGLLALVAIEPRVTGENLMRVGALWASAIALGIVDRGLVVALIRGGRRSIGGGLGRTLPLAWLLRRLKRLSPACVLSLIECESVLRERSLRWPLLVGVAFMIVASGIPDVAILAVVLASTVSLNSHRAELTLPTCRVWKESFSLPTTLLSGLRAMGRVPSLILAALIVGAVCLVALRTGLSQDCVLVAFVVGIAASAVIVSDGFYGWYDVRWQSVGQNGADAGSKMLANGAFLVGLLVFAFAGFFASLFGIAEAAPGVALGVSFSAVVLSLVVWRVFRVRQVRRVREGGLGLLVRRESR